MDSIRVSDPKEEEGMKVVGNPCLAKGTRRVVTIDDERSGVQRNVTMDGEEVGSFEGCKRVIELVMAKDAYVSLSP
jgi:guanosine-diphosphatase